MNTTPPDTTWDGKPPESFHIAIAEDDLRYLRESLARTRWPDQIPGERWLFGTDIAYLKSLCSYWRDEYDWRVQERRLNEFSHYKAGIAGIKLHYIHEIGEGENPRALLLTHGWPDSFYGYHQLIPRLTHPSRFGGRAEDAFTVVVPSIPGYGFSYEPDQPRFGLNEIADSLKTLMVDVLGYAEFAAHGYDWGAFIATRLGYVYPEHLRGIHITRLAMPRKPSAPAPRTPEESRFYRQVADFLKDEAGYSDIMGTKPQTLAYALTDSPAGLAAWIIEKFRTWSDCGGDVDAHFGRDVLLTNIMMYWITGAIGSTFWPYYGRHHEPWIVPDGATMNVPTAYAEFPKETFSPPRSIAETLYGNIQRWTTMPNAGHFPALEASDALAHDIREFFVQLK
ncbi:epoxide hydrolase family protein [Bordetella sp. BOR01]|uniref:epoxide hydrolase family protein n=1 Tax=Bordetella sp. BOR01 TaxID=2854779 RepID=UPI001C484760|nr:epoxide hydrolase family protein [Bordetella sp. BOR01]MBV7484383.1 epoxide hydrolase [Bordetella sp. BOR01]